MKRNTPMNSILKTLAGFSTASLLALAPIAVSADSIGAHAGTGIFVNPQGIVRVIGGEVTSVGSNVINVATTFGSTVLNWIVNVTTDTKIMANGSKSASTTDIKVGDKVAFSGSATGSTTPFSVTAKRIFDLTTLPFRAHIAGKVTSVNTANGTFTLEKGDRTITVQTNASTTVMVDGDDARLSAISVGDHAVVAGSADSNTSTLTAAKVVVRGDNGEHKGEKKYDKERGHRIDPRVGLRLFGGLHFGKDD